MADPKVKYDIEANVSGNADVGKLATQIEQLAGTLDGDLKTSALASADALRQLAAKDNAIDNFVNLKREAQQAAQGLKDAQSAAQAMGQQLAATEAPTRAQTGQMAKLRDAVQAAKTEVVTSNAALNQARGVLDQYGVSTANLSAKQTQIKGAIADATAQVKAMAPAWQSAANAASSAAGQQVQATKQIEGGLDTLKGQLDGLRNIAIAALGGSYVGGLAKDLADTADAYSNLAARIKLSTGEGAAFDSTFQGVFDVALRTNSAVEETGVLFTKLNDAGKLLGLTQRDALGLTETINQAIQLSGASADASKASITQLVQGLQSGVLRGDEFNSVMEQSPRLAKALADGLGVTTGELRKQAEAGRLSSEVVIKALQGQADVVAGEFSKLPPTVGRAIQNLSTSWTQYIGETDKAMGASSAAGAAINALAKNLSTVAGLLIDAGQAGTAFVAVRLAQHFLGIGAAAQAAAVQVAASTAAITASNAATVVSAAAGAAGVNRFAGAFTGLGAEVKSVTSSASSSVSKFAGLVSGLKMASLLGIVTNFHDIGTAIGQGIAKLAGFKDKTDEIAAADKTANEIAQANVQIRRDQAAALQAATDKTFGLTKTGRELVSQFDEMRTKGDSANEAIKKIGKDFDLKSVPGIADAASVLDKLASDGKISAGQFQAAWSEAIKGSDLAVFEVNARAAFAGATREAERMGQVIDATLRESIRRTGLDFDVISGGMGAASRSAINDTQAMISGLERLKSQGVDVAQALTASIGQGIKTADSQAAVTAVRQQVETLRGKLGDKVVDGLLDQATQKATALKDAMEAATPGIDSVREAMKQLGITSDQTLKDAAAKSAAAYTAMRDSGTSSARELAEGFKRYAADAIAANGGVATEALKSEAAMRGLEIQTDNTGRAIVKAMDGGAASTAAMGEAVRLTTEQLKAQQAALDAVNAKYAAPKLQSTTGSTRAERLSGQNAVDDTLRLRLAQKLQAGTLTSADAADVKAFADAVAQNVAVSQGASPGLVSVDFLRSMQTMQNQVALMQQALAARPLSAAPASTVNVQISLPGSATQTVPTTQAGATALIAALQGAKLAAGY